MRKLVLLTVVFLVSVTLAFAAGSREEVSDDPMSGTITLYTSESLTDAQALVDRFEQLNPGSTVEVFRLGTTELVARLMTEIEAGEVGADVVWFADMALFESFAADGLLLPIDPSEAANVPDSFVYFDGMAYEVRLIYQIIMYNTNLVNREITSWFDMADPEFRGMVGSASPFVSGATVTQIASVVQDPNLGWELYEQLAANDTVISGGNGGIAQGIALGEYALGLTIDFMARTQQDQGSPVNYVFPEEGAVYVPTPAGVMASTSNPELSTAFVNFLMSEPGQEVLMDNGYMPVNVNMPLPEGVPSPADIPVLSTDWDFLAENREMLLDRFAEIFGID